jgi:hypothetical protein
MGARGANVKPTTEKRSKNVRTIVTCGHGGKGGTMKILIETLVKKPGVVSRRESDRSAWWSDVLVSVRGPAPPGR